MHIRITNRINHQEEKPIQPMLTPSYTLPIMKLFAVDTHLPAYKDSSLNNL